MGAVRGQSRQIDLENADVGDLDDAARPSKRRRLFFRHSAWDLAPVLICIAYPTLLVLTALHFEQLSVAALVGLAVLGAYLWHAGSWGHHHHGHLFFFRSNTMNRAFEIWCSAIWKVPLAKEVYHHKIHHTPGFLRQYWEELLDDGNRSRFRILVEFAELNSPKALFYRIFDQLGLRYLFEAIRNARKPLPSQISSSGKKIPAAFSWQRRTSSEPGDWIAFAKSRKQLLHVFCECSAMVLFNLALLVINCKFYLFFYVPLHILSVFGAEWSDFSDHFLTDLRYEQTDSVSSYNRWYNMLLLNGGHHAEHHFRPGTHWTRMPEVRNKLMVSPAERRVLPGTLLNPFVRRKPLIARTSNVRLNPGRTMMVSDEGPDALRLELGSASRVVASDFKLVIATILNAPGPVSVDELCHNNDRLDPDSIVSVVDWLRQHRAIDIVFPQTQRDIARLRVAERTLPHPMPESLVRR